MLVLPPATARTLEARARFRVFHERDCDLGEFLVRLCNHDLLASLQRQPLDGHGRCDDGVPRGTGLEHLHSQPASLPKRHQNHRCAGEVDRRIIDPAGHGHAVRRGVDKILRRVSTNDCQRRLGQFSQDHGENASHQSPRRVGVGRMAEIAHEYEI